MTPRLAEEMRAHVDTAMERVLAEAGTEDAERWVVIDPVRFSLGVAGRLMWGCIAGREIGTCSVAIGDAG